MGTSDERYFLDCIKQGTNHYWRTLGRCRNMELHGGDVEYVMSNPRGGIERIFNVQIPPERVERRIDELIAEIEARAVPDNILILPGTAPANLGEILAGRGFTIHTSGLGMAMAPADLRVDPPAPGRVKVVEDNEALRQWGEVVSIALFEGDLLTFEQFGDLARTPGARLYLALHDGRPAATAMTLTAGDQATVELVSTLPAYRNKGLGTAATIAGLVDLRERGVRTVSLRAEPMAEKLYRRVGFREYCQRVVASFNWS